MQTTMQAAQRKVRREFENEMDDPRRNTISAVRAQWPRKSQIRSGKFTAKVFILKPLANAIHAITFGDTIGLTPYGNGVVVTPVHIRLNRFGNIPRGRLDKMRADKKKYFEVKIGSRDPRTNHLEPGIYERRTAARRSRQRGRRTFNSPTLRRGLTTRFVIMMVAYERQRTYRHLIDYHETIERCFESRFFRDLERRVFADKVFRARRGLL
jgi:hypothetical protein